MAAKQNPERTKPLRIHQSIAREIGIAILSGEYAPGESFDGEIERSAELGVSRTAYREAIRILIAKGLIESRPKAGSHVTPRNRWNLLDPEVLSWIFARNPDKDFVTDLFELRLFIEPPAASLAAGRRSDEQLAKMHAAIEDMRKFGLATKEGRAADRRFHDTLIESSGNLALGTLTSSIGAAVEWTTHIKQERNTAPRDPLPDHEAVLDAIEKQDPDRASLEMQHLIRRASEDMDQIVASKASR